MKPQETTKVIYKIIIQTDSYSGNFERELGAYITGMSEYRGESEAENANDNMSRKSLDEIEESITTGEGDEIFNICPNPNYWNDGYGNIKKLKVGEENKSFPAYMGIEIFFNDVLSQNTISEMKERAEEYCNNNNIVLESFSFSKEVVHATVHRAEVYF